MALTRPKASQIITTSADFSDPLIVINKDQTGANDKDIGFVFERGSDTNVAIIWDESLDQFAFINTTETGSTNGNVAISSYAGFRASNITADLTGAVTGNASTATTLQTARTIAISGDVTGSATSFNGSANITISAGITADSIVNADINSSAGIVDTKLATISTAGKVSNSATTATNANTASAIVARDASGNFSAGTITAALSGNASTASTWATARTITLGGVLSGSVSINGSSNVTLTAAHTSDPVITLTGDVTGSATMTNLGNVSITATVVDDSHNHIIGNVDGLQTALDAKAALAGATFTGDVAGTNLTLSGNLTVSGTTTYINTTTLNIGDNIITLNADETGTPSQNAGIEIERGTSTNVILQWNETSDQWEIASGGTTGRILTTGDEGSGNGLDADTLDSLQATSFLRSDVDDTLNATITIAAGENLKYIDKNGTFPTTAGKFEWDLNNDYASIGANQPSSDTIDLTFLIRDNATTGTDRYVFHIDDYQGSSFDTYPAILTGTVNYLMMGDNGSGAPNTASARVTIPKSGNVTLDGNRILTVADEGSGNGLDADTLDGQQGSYYLDWTNVTNKPDPVITLAGDLSGSVTLTDLASATLTATLTKDPTITLTGDVTGSATMTNLGNVSISTTVAANSVALGTDTTGNYVAGITNGTYITGGNGGSEGAALTLAVDATTTNTASKVVARDASGNFSAGTITASLTGNASTASTWAAARTITLGGVLSGSVSINGSSDVTLTAAHTSDPVITLTGAVTGTGTMTNLGNVSITTTATSDPVITLAGDLSGSATLTNLGSATLTATITKDPVITLTGDVTGSATMTNLGNVSISTTVAANSVALGTDTTGNYVATIAGTVNEITVTGSGSETAAVTIALPDDVTIGDTLTVTGNLFVDTNTLYVDAVNNAVGVGTSTPNTYGKTVSSGDIAALARGLLKFYDTDSSNYVALRAASTVAANITWTLPASDGSSGQVLSTDGSGNLSWAAAGTGGGSSGYQTSTVTTIFGNAGNYDLAEGPNQDGDETPFSSGGTDAFGVSLGTVYDTMEPIGSIITLDYGDGEAHVGA